MSRASSSSATVARELDDDGDLPTFPDDWCDDPIRAGDRRWDDVAGGVDEALGCTDRVSDLDIGVAEAGRQRRTQRPRCGRLA